MTKTTKQRLYRSETDRVIAGVAGGIAEHLNIDATLVRVLFVLLTLWGGGGLVLYLILWILVPSQSYHGSKAVEKVVRTNAEELGERAEALGEDLEAMAERAGIKTWWAVILILLGVVFLLGNLGVVSLIVFGKLWPLLLVIVGLIILANRDRP
ncbi:PspC domain-containing protein [Candidatus Berkelbacteria bacterium]|nr:PspC domain-containing protein [Candidatus Berkelbacteria bacterium]